MIEVTLLRLWPLVLPLLLVICHPLVLAAAAVVVVVPPLRYWA